MVVGYNPTTQENTVSYDDGEQEELLLGPGTEEIWRLEEDDPEEQHAEEEEEEEDDEEEVGRNHKPRKPLRRHQAPPAAAAAAAAAGGDGAPNGAPARGALAEFQAQLGPQLATFEATGGEEPHGVLQGATEVGRVRVGGVLHKSPGVCVCGAP
jgi:hypothetical protein